MNSKASILLSIGCNKQYDNQMVIARKRLAESFPGIRFTDAIMSPAYGKENAEPYANMLAKTSTTLPENELKTILKGLEKEMGDTAEKRSNGIVMMDLDILEYANEKRHLADWERPYIKTLLTRFLSVILMLTLCTTLVAQTKEELRKQDAELLGKAVEYFQSGKYHESILTFTDLQKRYKLNPRFLGYLGMSYYKEMQYEEAALYLKQGIPELTAFSPKEQAVYIYSCAESLFHLTRYAEAIEYYKQALPLTDGTNKGDILFHAAIAYYLQNDTASAIPLLDEALILYKSHTSTNDHLHAARLKQTETMLKGMKRDE